MYKINNFKVRKGSIIFTNSYFIKNLFKLIKNLDSNLDLILVTNQTDLLLDEYIYNFKPDCIKKWYSINVEHESEDVIPLPLGLSNSYSPKNLLPEDFINFKENNESKKIEKVYVNFNKNTNFKERESLYDKFQEEDWAVVENPNLDKSEYYNNLSRYKFSLAPWGNGVDTHRIWESLYLGTVPITKYHHTFSTSSNLPILFVNDYEEINKSLIENFLKDNSSKNYNYELLNSKYWTDLISKDSINNSDYQYTKTNNLISLYYLYNYRIKQLILRYYKILIFYSKKIFKVINLVKK